MFLSIDGRNFSGPVSPEIRESGVPLWGSRVRGAGGAPALPAFPARYQAFWISGAKEKLQVASGPVLSGKFT